MMDEERVTDTVKPTDFRGRPVGEVVAEDYRRAAVFKRFGIDFCCGGGRTVAKACERKGVAYEELESALVSSTRSRDEVGPDPDGWEIDALVDHIEEAHHGYVRDSLPVLSQFSTKVAKVHGAARPEVIAIARLVEELASELESHMKKEEDILFPYAKALAEARRNGAPLASPIGEPALESIRTMTEEHGHVGELMRQIGILSDGYAPPDWACNTYRANYVKLEEFEKDLHRHVHLEHHLLFPEIERLEREVAGVRG